MTRWAGLAPARPIALGAHAQRVHVRPPDCACANVRILLTLLVLDIRWFCSCLFLVQEMSQAQQESDRQKRLERRRHQDRDKKRLTRETEGVFFNARSYYFMRAYAWSSNWGERERGPTLFMSMEIVYVRASTSDRQAAHARTLFEFC